MERVHSAGDMSARIAAARGTMTDLVNKFAAHLLDPHPILVQRNESSNAGRPAQEVEGMLHRAEPGL
jgi:hypothetical protein